MPKEIESVLTKAHRESLEIVDFIFHIISQEDSEEKVIYIDGVELQPSQEKFFLDRLREIASGTQYIFKSDAVNLKNKSEELSNSPVEFLDISRAITFDFAERHSGNMSEGVFIIAKVRFQFSEDTSADLLFLVKMDKQPSLRYSYSNKNGKKIAKVEEIQDSLNENKNAIQKSALIDMTGVFKWDVLAFDRSSRPTLTDYYRAFLGVIERQVDSELTQVAHRTVRKWARSLSKEDLPEGEDAATFSGRSFNYLSDNDKFDTDNFIDTVVRSPEPEKKEKLCNSLRRELEESGVAGQTFTPQPNSIPGKEKKEKYETAEGVVITYEGDKESAGIKIKELEDGRTVITIETSKLEIK